MALTGPVTAFNRKLDRTLAKHLNLRHIPNEIHLTPFDTTCYCA